MFRGRNKPRLLKPSKPSPESSLVGDDGPIDYDCIRRLNYDKLQHHKNYPNDELRTIISKPSDKIVSMHLSGISRQRSAVDESQEHKEVPLNRVVYCMNKTTSLQRDPFELSRSIERQMGRMLNPGETETAGTSMLGETPFQLTQPPFQQTTNDRSQYTNYNQQQPHSSALICKNVNDKLKRNERRLSSLTKMQPVSHHRTRLQPLLASRTHLILCLLLYLLVFVVVQIFCLSPTETTTLSPLNQAIHQRLPRLSNELPMIIIEQPRYDEHSDSSVFAAGNHASKNEARSSDQSQYAKIPTPPVPLTSNKTRSNSSSTYRKQHSISEQSLRSISNSIRRRRGGPTIVKIKRGQIDESTTTTTSKPRTQIDGGLFAHQFKPRTNLQVDTRDGERRLPLPVLIVDRSEKQTAAHLVRKKRHSSSSDAISGDISSATLSSFSQDGAGEVDDNLANTSSASDATSVANPANNYYPSTDNESQSDGNNPQPSNAKVVSSSKTNEDYYEPKLILNGTTTTSTTKKRESEKVSRVLDELKQKYVLNRPISNKVYYLILSVYVIFAMFGALANSIICLTVILKPKILSHRNIFILNLASSDLLLCIFTMPFSFIEISTKTWPMGELPCKLVSSLQATSIFVSTISITAIALDRYRVIVYSTHQDSGRLSSLTGALILLSVWGAALILSLPLFISRQVKKIKMPDELYRMLGIDQEPFTFCYEEWPFTHGRGIYSVVSMFIQYVVPITIVSIVYVKISDKLQKRLIRRQRLTPMECQQKRQLQLINRTHNMLITVSLVFGLCWLPLNLLNVIVDFTEFLTNDENIFRTVFAICHLTGCFSACSNPILYGYMNENFRKEIILVYSQQWQKITRYLCRFKANSRSTRCTAATTTTTSTATKTRSASETGSEDLMSSDDERSSCSSSSSGSSSSTTLSCKGSTTSCSSSSSKSSSRSNQSVTSKQLDCSIASHSSKLCCCDDATGHCFHANSNHQESTPKHKRQITIVHMANARTKSDDDEDQHNEPDLAPETKTRNRIQNKHWINRFWARGVLFVRTSFGYNHQRRGAAGCQETSSSSPARNKYLLEPTSASQANALPGAGANGTRKMMYNSIENYSNDNNCSPLALGPNREANQAEPTNNGEESGHRRRRKRKRKRERRKHSSSSAIKKKRARKTNKKSKSSTSSPKHRKRRHETRCSCHCHRGLAGSSLVVDNGVVDGDGLRKVVNGDIRMTIKSSELNGQIELNQLPDSTDETILRTCSTGSRPAVANCVSAEVRLAKATGGQVNHIKPPMEQIDERERRRSSTDVNRANDHLNRLKTLCSGAKNNNNNANSNNHHSRHIKPIDPLSAPIGQRVWLRFFPSMQRYCFNQNSSNTFQPSPKRQESVNGKATTNGSERLMTGLKIARHCSICRPSAERRKAERKLQRRLRNQLTRQTNENQNKSMNPESENCPRLSNAIRSDSLKNNSLHLHSQTKPEAKRDHSNRIEMKQLEQTSSRGAENVMLKKAPTTKTNSQRVAHCSESITDQHKYVEKQASTTTTDHICSIGEDSDCLPISSCHSGSLINELVNCRPLIEESFCGDLDRSLSHECRLFNCAARFHANRMDSEINEQSDATRRESIPSLGSKSWGALSLSSCNSCNQTSISYSTCSCLANSSDRCQASSTTGCIEPIVRNLAAIVDNETEQKLGIE